MPAIRGKQEVAALTRAFATRYKIVEYLDGLYMPVDFLTLDPLPASPDRTVWKHLSDRVLRGIANGMLDILFTSDSEERSFKLMLKQYSQPVQAVSSILVRIRDERVMLLNNEGNLEAATGDFSPNYLNVPYDENNPFNDILYATISEWVGGDEQAESLLNHLATALQPLWSAVKYILLIGEGRNGKSTLLKMITALFGEDNISNITRQAMAAQSPIISTLNGKLLNVVFDGPKEFIKDSHVEKSVIAGDRLMIEMKYENAPKLIHTTALFIEGLQQEPKVSDKSPALQKRLVRYHFGKVYDLDLAFEEKMLQPQMIAAFLHLLLQHWVMKDEVATKLALTAESLDMQLNAVWSNSPVMRFLEWIGPRQSSFLMDLQNSKIMVETFLTSFRTWMESNGYRNVEDDYMLQLLKDHFVTDRKTFRVQGVPSSRRYIKRVLPDTMNAINLLLQGHSLDEMEEIEVLED